MLKKATIVILGAAALILLNHFQLPVKNFFYSASLPFQEFLSQAGDSVSNAFSIAFEATNLKNENEELRRRMQEAIAKNAELLNIENENEILREALRANSGKKFEIFVSQMASRSISGKDSIRVKGGTQDGINEGFPVITKENVLVGRVSRAYDNFSEVTLISAEDFAFDVKIVRDQESIFGIARGEGNLKLKLDKVQLQSEIKAKDVLVTAVLGGIFPEDMLVGEIERVKKSDTEPFQQAEVSPFFTLRDLKTLFIVKKW